MTFAICQARGQNQLAPAPAYVPPSICSFSSEAGDFNVGKDDAVANHPTLNPIVTINVTDLQSI